MVFVTGVTGGGALDFSGCGWQWCSGGVFGNAGVLLCCVCGGFLVIKRTASKTHTTNLHATHIRNMPGPFKKHIYVDWKKKHCLPATSAFVHPPGPQV